MIRFTQIHADIVLSQDIYDYAPLFVELADAYFERDMFTEARPIYESLGTDETVSDCYLTYVYFKLYSSVLRRQAVSTFFSRQLRVCGVWAS